MYTLVMASQKGGSGKTTLSGHLAVEAERVGAGPVALIDTDPQGSLSMWWNVRKAETPHFAQVGLLDLGEALERLRAAGIKLAVIDTPPAITGSISQVVAHADLVLVPTRPSPHDLRAVAATVDIAERHDKPLIFVINGATARARITSEAAVALSQHGTVAPVTVHHRVDFAASMVDGRTVGEVVPKSQSTREITDLWVYVQERLSRVMRDPQIMPEFRSQHLVSALSLLDEQPAVEERAPEPAEEVRAPAAVAEARAPVPVPAVRAPGVVAPTHVAALRAPAAVAEVRAPAAVAPAPVAAARSPAPVPEVRPPAAVAPAPVAAVRPPAPVAPAPVAAVRAPAAVAPAPVAAVRPPAPVAPAPVAAVRAPEPVEPEVEVPVEADENLPPKVWEGTEHRTGMDRRVVNGGPIFGGMERRTHVFGRRASDQPHFGHAGEKK